MAEGTRRKRYEKNRKRDKRKIVLFRNVTVGKKGRKSLNSIVKAGIRITLEARKKITYYFDRKEKESLESDAV